MTNSDSEGGMVLETADTIKLFCQKAELVSAKIQTFPDVTTALAFAVDICSQKEACTLLPSGCQADLSEPAEALCDTKTGKTIAAPEMGAEDRDVLTELCQKAGIAPVFEKLRRHLGGIDIGITWAQYGIAETGTLVIDSSDEDLRLATMISEIHMVLLEIDKIHASAADLSDTLKTQMRNTGNYTAMITGASRTADIERVLALGVHGPLELYILLIEGEK